MNARQSNSEVSKRHRALQAATCTWLLHEWVKNPWKGLLFTIVGIILGYAWYRFDKWKESRRVNRFE